MKKVINLLAANKELVLVVMVLFVLLMMIVPLSTIVMDFIIAFNISITVLIMMVVIYMRSPLGLTSFPSILLVLALVRIGITVSTSRLILLDGDAGDIVSTFGEFVVGGNLIVGVIIFSTITIVNFIVITKGSERVAEVAARFSLDAMPGKQMSIDSDLRAGNITMEEATAKRKDLALESKLYGAMDGAMKFVKGDSIASIVDILINLVGGIIIGVVQKDMDFSSSLKMYSILTVGDGLVQQIPALMISLTAGMMITRVSDGEDESMGHNILGQVFRDYKAIFAAGGLVMIMAFIPGMPSAVFATLFGFLVFFGVILRRKKFGKGGDSGKNTIAESAVLEDGKTSDSMVETPQDVSKNMQLLPLIVYLAPSYKNSDSLAKIKEIIVKVQQHIITDLGVLMPQIVIRYNNSLSDGEYQLLVFEIPVATGRLNWNSLLLLDQKEQHLSVLDMKDSFVNKTSFGEKDLGIWINNSNLEACTKYNLRNLTCEQFLLLHLKYQLTKHVSDFLGIQEVKVILDKMQDYQDLIKELLRMLPLNKITELFQRLVAENISIRNFKVILDTMLEWSQHEKDTILLTEYVRKALGKYIAYKFTDGKYIFACVLLSPEIEDMVRDSIRYANNGSYLALDPTVSAHMVENIKQIVNNSEGITNLIVLTHLDIRRYVRSVIEKELPYLPVMSYQELEGHADFNSVGVVGIDEESY
ncbi:MAG: type III secretion system export apparatus subunit SctV [Proteobacteria bacterium]|jgi:type III secretion protein V|nr:type III secretion system export apparatus subunit SctV [Pseudomonadota bacterium]